MKFRQAFLFFILLFALSYFLINERELLPSVQFSVIMFGVFWMIRRTVF